MSNQHSHAQDQGDLYLGFDLSTQQLKVVALTRTPGGSADELEPHSSFAVHFDNDLSHCKTVGGVTLPSTSELRDAGVVTAPVMMWVEALERLLDRMRRRHFPFERVVSVSGAAQQHGSVYWSQKAEEALQSLKTGSVPGFDNSTASNESTTATPSQLCAVFSDSFTVTESPIWQDTSTSSQCREMEEFLGWRARHKGSTGDKAGSGVNEKERNNRQLGQQILADLTGSRAFERFTASQILKLVQEKPKVYEATARISLVSSFLASVLTGSFASIDMADGSGMNLLNVETKSWEPCLTEFISRGGAMAYSDKAAFVEPSVTTTTTTTTSMDSLRSKLGEVDSTGCQVQGHIGQWFCQRYGFRSDVKVITFTGDNPATVMALTAERGDAIVSLGTSDTLVLYKTGHTIGHSSSTNQQDNENEAEQEKEQEQEQGQKQEQEQEERLSLSHLCHPIDPQGFLMLYCAKNGSLARERVRDLYAHGDWEVFDRYLQEASSSSSSSTSSSASLADKSSSNKVTEPSRQEPGQVKSQQFGFYFFESEIWPPLQGVYRFQDGQPVTEFYDPAQQHQQQEQEQDHNATLSMNEASHRTYIEGANVVCLCESQFMAMRIRATQHSKEEEEDEKEDKTSSVSSLAPPGVSRILATGGASSNVALLQLLADIFGVPVVQKSDKNGAGSAAWGAARKAYLYSGAYRDDQTRVVVSPRTSSTSSERVLQPSLDRTKSRISNFLDESGHLIELLTCLAERLLQHAEYKVSAVAGRDTHVSSQLMLDDNEELQVKDDDAKKALSGLL
ncbi:hypothetical protein BGZ94_009273 [Podila epigama]|nr:hypothetical protein BGZ94_009273 [Podila epigama]